MSGPFLVEVDATQLAPELKGATIAAWVFAPSKSNPSRPVAVFGYPGGTYTKSYYHLVVPGHGGYSLAEHLVRQGCFFVACDYLGLGDSSALSGSACENEDIVVAGCRLVFTEVQKRLREGTLLEGVGRQPDLTSIGIGHSLGGYTTLRHQAYYESFDALGILGWSNLVDTTLAPPPPPDPELGDLSGSSGSMRALLNPFFHQPDVPEAVRLADDAGAVEMQPWMLATDLATRCARSAESASTVKVPVFLAFAEHDLTDTPRREPVAYTKAHDITLQVIPRAGHCFNFASHRQEFYERLGRWILALL